MGRSPHDLLSAYHDPRLHTSPTVTPGVDEPAHYALNSDALASPADSILLTPSPGPGAVGSLDSGILSTMPGEVKHVPLLSPPDLEANIVQRPSSPLVGGPLAVIPTTLPPAAPPAAREGPGGLRLPSFQKLGIAVPHPDRPVRPLARDDSPVLPGLGGLDIASPDVPDSSPTKSDGGRAVQSPVYHFVNPLTPPTDYEQIVWASQQAVQTAGMHSPPAQASNEAEQSVNVSSPGGTTGVATAAAALEGQIATVVSINEFSLSGSEQRQWIDDAISTLLNNLRTSSRPKTSFKVLSHALPSTSTTGHIFPKLINAIHQSNPDSPATPMTWINVFHAIPGRFNLADLPSSPPSTPGPAIGGEDYFTQKTFDSAVSISDYQVASPLIPRSPRPVVPPSSIDVSIVERYIPPSTLHEFAEMFDPNGSSILVDRLVELSPDNGSLLFVYPTKAGGETFMRDYLGPVLDPLLRTMSVVDGLPTNMCRSIGTMAAVPSMYSHSSLHQAITALCAQLSQQETAAQPFHPRGQRPQFSVSYSGCHRVHLSRGVWAREWWTKQEKVRIKEILHHHGSRDSRRLSLKNFGVPATTGIVLLQTLLEGVIGHQALEKEIPASAGIEVGVFVVKRTL